MFNPESFRASLPEYAVPVEDLEEVVNVVKEKELKEEKLVVKKASTAPVKVIPKWEQEDYVRIKEALKNYVSPLKQLIERDAAESDTRILITDMLYEAFGFQKYQELRTEQLIAKEYADYVLQVEGKQLAVVEAKRVGLSLKDSHFKQAKQYAVNEGIEWIILTNGRIWQVYFLTGGLPVIHEKVLEFDILSESHSLDEKIERMSLITRESMRKGKLDSYRVKMCAQNPNVLMESLFTEEVLTVLRREVKKQTKVNLSLEDIENILRKRIIKEEFFQQ